MSRATKKKKQAKRSPATRSTAKRNVSPERFLSSILSDLSVEQSPEDLESYQVIAALEWSGLDNSTKEVLAMGGIHRLEDYVQVRSRLQPKAPKEFFANWIAAYGLGVAPDTGDLADVFVREYFHLLKVRVLSRLGGIDGRLDDLANVDPSAKFRPECFYLELPSGLRFHHTHFERDTPERRIWIEDIAGYLGILARYRL